MGSGWITLMELCIVEVNVSSRYARDCSSLEPCSVQFTEILGIFTHESYSKPAFAYQSTVCQKKKKHN